MLLVLFAISILTFVIFNVIPAGDPAVRMAGKSATPTTIEAIRRDWGFDEPVYKQYLKTMEKVFSGNLVSYIDQRNVLDEIKHRAPRTFSLAIGAAFMWMIIAVAMGLYTAVKAGRFADRFLTVIALVGISMPVFWIGALINYYLGFKAGIFPNGGYVPLTEDPIQWAYHLLMPWTTLSLLFIGIYSRVLRGNVLDTMNDDYVRTARAKGLTEQQVMLRHSLRTSMIAFVSLFGLDFGALVGGAALLTEVVFGLHGVGKLTYDSLQNLDLPVIMAAVMYAAFFVVFVNAIVDVLYAWLDPRVRYA